MAEIMEITRSNYQSLQAARFQKPSTNQLARSTDIMHNWHEPTYLKTGTPRQQAVYKALILLGVFDTLKAFTPTIAGSIPIDIDVPGSDIDIICHAVNLETFEHIVRDAYADRLNFRIKCKSMDGIQSIVARFSFCGFLIEIFGQALPIEAQRAYRHMIVEARLLKLFGEHARTMIRKLKQSGLKTEPAFGHYFQLEGDPYLVLLKLEKLSDNELLKLFSQSHP